MLCFFVVVFLRYFSVGVFLCCRPLPIIYKVVLVYHVISYKRGFCSQQEIVSWKRGVGDEDIRRGLNTVCTDSLWSLSFQPRKVLLSSQSCNPIASLKLRLLLCSFTVNSICSLCLCEWLADMKENGDNKGYVRPAFLCHSIAISQG